jgi:endonuclease/exonuclease/phosphatase family metal-dependent hydrolase
MFGPIRDVTRATSTAAFHKIQSAILPELETGVSIASRCRVDAVQRERLAQMNKRRSARADVVGPIAQLVVVRRPGHDRMI